MRNGFGVWSTQHASGVEVDAHQLTASLRAHKSTRTVFGTSPPMSGTISMDAGRLATRIWFLMSLMKIRHSPLHFSLAAMLLLTQSVSTRANASDAKAAQVELAPKHDGQHDFDFNIGTWKTHVSRLLRPLSGSNTWGEYDGIASVRNVMHGRANLLELDVDGAAGHIEGIGVRLYNPASGQWSLNWANGNDSVMTQPMIGEFKNGRGDFFDQEVFNGKSVLTRNGFSDITPNSSRFEQAFSADGGKTWETNWVMTFTRTADETGKGRP
jgi:hypothetical protein